MQLMANIVVLTSIYALISCGYVLIYRVGRVLNLAHGELMMFGAYLLLVTAGFSGNPMVAIPIAAIMSLTMGALVYLLLMRRMTGESVPAAILTTIALGILLRGLDSLVGALVGSLIVAAAEVLLIQYVNPLLTGIAGQISLGHAGLLAAGAFTAGILWREVGAPFWVGIPASGPIRVPGSIGSWSAATEARSGERPR